MAWAFKSDEALSSAQTNSLRKPNVKRPFSRPVLRFKDSAKRDVVSIAEDPNSWEREFADYALWRKPIAEGVSTHAKDWFDHLSRKRTLHHQHAAQPRPLTPTGQQHVCSHCGRGCRPRIGLRY
ncbi:unnamed protein product [Arctia plantaginis]|uniref:Uncharacterized protein n=1 Tax=Arctia plantaginis TaxID=874455 RepID=A0A8S0ZU65_ARCPL|nr:unnamed protein product [Arctia plantaginis]CAB3261245.1 unnamed protein product [Arctia plantaginis]